MTWDVTPELRNGHDRVSASASTEAAQLACWPPVVATDVSARPSTAIAFPPLASSVKHLDTEDESLTPPATG